MKCPHCLENFHDEWQAYDLDVPQTQKARRFQVERTICPACNNVVIRLRFVQEERDGWIVLQVWPRGSARPPLSPAVPESYASDYSEAALILADSPKASAALGRRCLQDLLREVAKVTPGDLFSEIGEVMPKLPAHLADAVDAVRNIGNLAAHPMKSQNTGAVLDVEPGEAEWLLEVLEGLFDFYFVQPELLAQRRQAINAKLAEAGKPSVR